MFFILSKLFWAVAEPISLLAILVLLAGGFLIAGFARTGRVFAIAAASLTILVGVIPFYLFLLPPLENRFERPAWPERVDGVLVLSGGIRTNIIMSRGVSAMEPSETRLVAAFELARRYPNARIVYSGGSGALAGSEFSEAEGARYIFAQMGLDPARLILEDQSRNTWENLVFSKRLVNPKGGEVWLLATSAFHMPRAMEVAARVEWKVLPWPTDYLTGKTGGFDGFFNIGSNFALMGTAFREWVGLVAYRVTDKAKSVK